MKINRSDFLRSLHSVEAGLTDKPVIEQSDTLAFKGGDVFTFNEYVACRAPSGLDESFTGAVPAKKFVEALSKLTSEEIDVEFEDGKAFVIDGKKTLWFVMEKYVLLPIDAVEKPKKWKDLPKDFAEAVDLVRRCVSTDEANDAAMTMTMVHVAKDWIEACDFFQICRWHTKTPISTPFLVQGKWIKGMVNLGMMKLSESESWVHFKNDQDVIFSCKRFVDEYKDLSPYLNVKGKKVSLPKSVVEAVNLAQPFAAENPDGERIKISLKKGKLVLSAESASGGVVDRKRVAYDGEPMTFYVAPKILADLAKNYSDCVVTEKFIKVNGEKFEYVLCLIMGD